MLWPTLRLGYRAAPSTVFLVLYLHLFWAPSQVFVLSVCSWYIFSPSLSLSFSPVRHSSRCSYYLCVHCLCSLSLVLSCLYRLSAFVFLERYTFIHSHWLFVSERIGASQQSRMIEQPISYKMRCLRALYDSFWQSYTNFRKGPKWFFCYLLCGKKKQQLLTLH